MPAEAPMDPLECRDEHREHRQKCLLQLARQSPELAVEASKPLERRHAYVDGSTGKSSSLAAIRLRCAANSSSRKIWPSVSRRTSERRSCSGRTSSEPSPTIRIDGVDVQPPGEEPVGLTCRVYHRRDGRISPTPDPADVRDALLAAQTATTTERR
jgi:hypothetical protein